MPDVEVHRGSKVKLGRVDGELKVGNKARIEASDSKLVIVSQGAYFEGGAEVNCSLECDSLRVEHGGILRVNGDLTVHKLLDVIHTIDARGLITAGEIDVGGRIYARSIKCEERIRVGGILDVQDTVESRSIDVGGKVKIGGPLKLQDLNVGGTADVAGGSITGKITAGGRFVSSSPLEFGDLDVLGRITLAPNCRGNRISTYGKLVAAGDLDCKEVDVKGLMEVRGNCRSEMVKTRGKLNISGSLAISGDLDTWSSMEVGGEVRSANLRIGGAFKAERAIVTNEIELAGHAETVEGMKGDIVTVASGSRCDGALVGTKKITIGESYGVVSNWSKSWAGQTATIRLIGKETRVQDIYAKQVHMGRSCRCGRVFVEVVEVEDGCTADEITYTRELRGQPQNCFFLHPPKKAEQLPDPPL